MSGCPCCAAGMIADANRAIAGAFLAGFLASQTREPMTASLCARHRADALHSLAESHALLARSAEAGIANP